MVKYGEENNDGEVSQWNEALFKMKRLHELQTEINRVKMNLLAKHPITGQWNYEIWFNSVLSLYSEGEAKYADKEKEEILNLKKIIEQLFKLKPVHSVKVQSSYTGTKKQYALNENNWEEIKKLVELLESKVKLYNDVHGLSTKNIENMDGRSILR